MSFSLAIKVDVDTARGTRIGVPQLMHYFLNQDIPATFLFSLGPDNTGRALKRIFRPGFFKKVSRTSVLKVYGIKTLGNGVFWPGPHIGQQHALQLRQVANEGFEVGIHCYDHIRWQDGLARMSEDTVAKEFGKSWDTFKEVFGCPAHTAGAAGWQANAYSLTAYDHAGLLYASDTRGATPFFPCVNGQIFKTLQIPTTLSTLDELYGRTGYDLETLLNLYPRWLSPTHLNVLTIHAELEGMAFFEWFTHLVAALRKADVKFVSLKSYAESILTRPHEILSCELVQGTVDGRSGTLACQGKSLK